MLKEDKVLNYLENQLCDKKHIISKEKKEIYDMIHSRKTFKMSEVRELLNRIKELKKKQCVKNG